MFGGWIQRSEQTLNTAYFLDLQSPRAAEKTAWNTKRPLPVPISCAAAASLIGGEVVVMGGGSSPYRGANVITECFIRHSLSDDHEWLPFASLTVPRCGHSVVVTFNNDIVVYGGYSGGTRYLASGECFDTGTERWIPLPDMHVPRSGLISVIDPYGCIMVAGGSPDGTIGHNSLSRLGR